MAGQVNAGKQATHGNSPTKINIWHSLNIRGRLVTSKFAFDGEEILTELVNGLSETHWRRFSDSILRNNNTIIC